MSAVAIPLVTTLVGGVLTSKLTKPKTPKSVPLRAPPQARASSAVRDSILARRGAAANQRTGMGGAEAPTGVKAKLGA